MQDLISVLVSHTFRVSVSGLLVLLILAGFYLTWLRSPGPGGKPWWQDPGRRWVAWFYVVAVIVLAVVNLVIAFLSATS